MSEQWRPISERPEFMSQPIRQFIRVEGWKDHSGELWRRVWCDVAFISKDNPLGYRQSDMQRIMRDGDMDVIERVTHWMPAAFPAVEP